MDSVKYIGMDVHQESCPIQDEPGEDDGFQHKMSLEKR